MIWKSPKLKSPRVLIPLGIIVFSVAVFLLLYFFKPSGDELAPKQQSWPVHTQSIILGNQTPQIILYGKVQTPRHTKLEAAITAFVKATPILVGESVKKGQLLVKLDERDANIILQQRLAEKKDLEAQLLQEKNLYKANKLALDHEKTMYNLAKKEMERLKVLAAKKYIAASDVDRAASEFNKQALLTTNRDLALKNHDHRLEQLKAKLAKADALLESAKLDITRANIVAPFDGRVTKLMVSVGDRVQPGEVIVEMYDPSVLEIKAQIPRRYVAGAQRAINTHQIIRAFAQNTDGKDISIVLERLSGNIGEGLGTIDGIFILVDPIKLPIGLSLPIIVNLPPIENSALLPVESLYNGNRIYKVINGYLEATNVKHLGNQYEKNNERLVIVKGKELKTGDVILTTHLPNAITGLKVKPITAGNNNAKKSH